MLLELAPRDLGLGGKKLRRGDPDVLVNYLMKMRDTCVLDLAEYPWTLDQIGRLFDVTRERIRQIEDKSLKKLRARLGGTTNLEEIKELLREVGAAHRERDPF